MRLLVMRLTVPKQRRLREMIKELLAPRPHFLTLEIFGVAPKASHIGCGLHWAASGERIGLIADPTLIDRLAHVSVPLVVVDRRDGTVNGNFVKIRTAQPNELRVGVGEEASLQERIVRKIDSRHDVARVEGDLFGLSKKVVRISIQCQLADAAYGYQLLRNEFGGIKQIEVKQMLILLFHHLHA